MATIIEKINAKFDNIHSMFVQLNAITATADQANSESYDHDTFETIWPKHLEWCRLYDQQQEQERKVKRAIRALAKEMGFTIKKQDFMSLASTWENIFDEMFQQWKKARAALYDMPYWYTWKTIEPITTDEQE